MRNNNRMNNFLTNSALEFSLCCLCSLQITPCCNLPLRNLKHGGQFAIVNLQSTPKDRKAALTVAERVDKVSARSVSTQVSLGHGTVRHYKRHYRAHHSLTGAGCCCCNFIAARLR